MSLDQEPGPPVEEPRFRVPFSDADRDLLEERVPHLLALLDETLDVRDAQSGHRLFGARETLSGIRALEVIGRLVEAMGAEMLAHYRRAGDSTAHGYRSTEQLLVGEFRITAGEARRRKVLSETLVSRISETGQELEPLRPAVAAEFANGRISADEAKALCDAVDDLPPTIHAMYADRVEKTLVELAPTVTLKDVPKLRERIIQHIDPDGTLPRHEPDPHKYSVSLTQQRNGDWRLRGLLDCPTGTTLRALLYGRMKDADVPVAVRPNRACNTDGTEPSPAETSCEETFSPSPPSRLSGSGTRPPGPDDTDDYSVTSAPSRARATDCSAPSRDDAHSDAGDGRHGAPQGGDGPRSVDQGGNQEETIPQIPLEAMWEDTRITMHADATIEVGGQQGTLVEDEPCFYLNPAGWPIHLSERVSEEAQRLLAEAKTSESGVATTVVWEKTLGRAPVGSTQPGEDSGSPPSSPPPGEQPAPPSPGEQPDPPSPGEESASTPPGEESASPLRNPSGSDCSDAAVDPRPVSAYQSEGVFADGSQSGRRTAEPVGADAPGLARHDRFAFLLRSVARERVLHGADHALVVTATADELTKPHSILNTHAGASTTLGNLERWSNAAQMFVHIKDGAGRSVGIRSQGRFATRTQMAVLAARDQGCTFPDCDAPAEWCEAHHIIAYARGGQTTVDNLTLVCPFHHRWFERSGWDSVFARGLPAWRPPKSSDPRQRLLFHSRFRIALLGLPPELPLGA